MRHILNFYNQAGAGANTLVKTFIESLYAVKRPDDEFIIVLPRLFFFTRENFEQKNNVRILYLPFYGGAIKAFFRFIYDFIAFPLSVLLLRPESVLIFGNYAPMPLFSKKIILCHHPHLVDDLLLSRYELMTRLVERIKRLLFLLTAISSDKIIVESDHMRDEVIKKYNISDKKICVVKNSISNSLNKSRMEGLRRIPHADRKIVLYVSRFEPHKNHSFLLGLADKYRESFAKMGITLCVTVDGNFSKAAGQFLDEIKNRHLDQRVINLGNLTHEELRQYYQNSLCLFFPSSAETFGIPLIEAMAFAMPIIVPDLPYAHSICGESARYYRQNSFESAFENIREIYYNESVWEEYSKSSAEQYKRYPSPNEWVEKYLALLR